MKTITKLFQLNFVPRSVDLGLCLLRVWFGLALLVLHGWGKLINFSTLVDSFPDPFHMGQTTSLVFAILTEVLCPVLMIVGLFTRLAALGSLTTMAVAWLIIHDGAISGTSSGELAAVYLGAYATIFLAGGGHFSMDSRLRAESK